MEAGCGGVPQAPSQEKRGSDVPEGWLQDHQHRQSRGRRERGSATSRPAAGRTSRLRTCAGSSRPGSHSRYRIRAAAPCRSKSGRTSSRVLRSIPTRSGLTGGWTRSTSTTPLTTQSGTSTATSTLTGLRTSGTCSSGTQGNLRQRRALPPVPLPGRAGVPVQRAGRRGRGEVRKGARVGRGSAAHLLRANGQGWLTISAFDGDSEDQV